MDTNAVVAIIGGALVAFIIRVFNVVVEWLSKLLGVDPPAPIPTAAATGERPQVAPSGTPEPVDPSQGHTGANPGT